MSIEYRHSGDLLAEDSAAALVNPVNSVGVMGRGLALQFKNAHPDNYSAYVAACRHRTVRPGRMFVYERNRGNNPRFIINFPTKAHWRDPSRMEYIVDGLDDLVRQVRRRGIESLAMPAIGCGLGGLPWRDVREAIESAAESIPDVRLVVFTPGPAG